jgi:hypothetical protein
MNVASSRKNCGVHLSEARRAQRLALEFLEQLAHPATQLALDDLFDLIKRDRRDLVLEFLELVDVGLGDQIRSRREHLAELDVGGTELYEPFPERNRLFRRASIPAALLLFRDKPTESIPVSEIAESVSGKEPHGGGEPG